jgi:hypothetical protein
MAILTQAGRINKRDDQRRKHSGQKKMNYMISACLLPLDSLPSSTLLPGDLLRTCCLLKEGKSLALSILISLADWLEMKKELATVCFLVTRVH